MLLPTRQRFHYLRTIQIAYPIMLGQLGHMLTGVADTVMVGQLGQVPLAAASLGHNLFALFLVIALGISAGITPHVAAADGRKDITENAWFLRQGLWVNVVTGLVLTGFMIISLPLVHYLQQSEDVVALALPYALVVGLSIFPLMIFQHYRQFAEGLSYTKVAMYMSIGCNVLNVGLNYVLIFGHFGFPRMELLGAGVATLISRCAMALLMFWYVYRAEEFRTFWMYRVGLRPAWLYFKRILEVGIPIALQYLFEVGAFITGAFIIGSLGSASLAAHQVAITLAATTYLAASGIAAAVTVRVGNYLGACDPHNLRVAARTGRTMVAMFMGSMSLMFILLRNYLPGLITDDAEVIQLAAGLLVVAGIFQLSDGIQVVGLGALRGLKDVRIPTLLAMVSYWVFGLPVAWVLGIHFEMGVIGVWWGLAAGLTCSAVLMYFRFRWQSIRLPEKPQPVEHAPALVA